MVRDLILAILTIRYGPEIVNIVGRLATQHRVALLAGAAVLLAVLGYWIWRALGKRREPMAV